MDNKENKAELLYLLNIDLGHKEETRASLKNKITDLQDEVKLLTIDIIRYHRVIKKIENK